MILTYFILKQVIEIAEFFLESKLVYHIIAVIIILVSCDSFYIRINYRDYIWFDLIIKVFRSLSLSQVLSIVCIQ